MKIPSRWIACLLIGSSLLSAAAEHAPTLKIAGDWIVVSGFRDSTDVGAMPWTCAIRRAGVMSVCIHIDYSAIHPTDGSKPKNDDGASAEEIAALPAYIEITTTEMDSDGRNKQYQVSGLTNGTAPAFLEKILEAAQKLESSGGTK